MRLLVAAGGAGLLIAFILLSLSEDLTTYTDFGTARQHPQRTYHVVAEWIERNQSYYDAAKDAFWFRAQDSTGHAVWVRYPDPEPVGFATAQRVVLIGQMRDTIFEAEKILMKCPSKYKEEEARADLP
jgi:cytochrome c-type biogenesis protein CcmE